MRDGGPAGWTESLPDWAGLAARLIVGLVLVFSGTLKAAGPPEEFALIIDAYNLVLVPHEMTLTLATFLPWAELLLGFSLIAGYFTRQAAAGAGALLLAFVGALASTKLRGIYLPSCGCFGMGWHLSPTLTILMDAGLAALSMLAAVKGGGRLSLDHWAGAD